MSASASVSQPDPFGPPRATRRSSLQQVLWGVRIGVVLMLAAAAFATPGFFAAPSLYAIMTAISSVGCIAVGMTLITISGNIMAFCLGATTAACSVIFLAMFNWAGLGPAIATTLAFGALVNAVQGLIIGWFRANPIIVSIGMLALIQGGFQALTEGVSLYAQPGPGLEFLKGKVLGLPVEFLPLLAVLAVGQFILSYTVFGRNLFLIGDSFAAAEAAGVVSWRAITGAYLWAGLFAAVPGIMLAARFGTGNMEYAQGYDYSAIAAILVGGTAMHGGSGSAVRTFVGVAFITVVQVILLLHGLTQQWQYFNIGIIVLAAIMLQGSTETPSSAPTLLTGKRMGDPHLRPVLLLLATLICMVVLDAGQGRILTQATIFSTLQTFSMFAMVALGLGLTMISGGYDLSVAGTFGMAGCIAVLIGVEYPVFGILIAMLAGIVAGATQAAIFIGLRVSSVGIALGGLLLFTGIAYLLTEGRAVPYTNMDVALAVNAAIGGVFSIRSIITIAIFVIAAFVIGWTRWGRDLIAIGSDRRAAMLAGVNVNGILVAIFAFSGATAALSGALLGYGLASASPYGLADVLLPATAAAILGGVSLSGGLGRPLGIAAGALTLALIRSGLNGLDASPAVHEIVTGTILLVVAIADGTATSRRLGALLPLKESGHEVFGRHLHSVLRLK
jgi:ribose/xylose/arabinose/galactoside ABC-type transport system permease subunit